MKFGEIEIVQIVVRIGRVKVCEENIKGLVEHGNTRLSLQPLEKKVS
jgi:hypothetical protein